MDRIQGLWLPLVTPFRDGELDEASLRRMARHYLRSTGRRADPRGHDRRGPDPRRRRDRAAGRYRRRGGRGPDSGLSRRVGELHPQGREGARRIPRAWPVDGYLIACPYYTRPSQEGLYRHFAALAGATGRPIIDLQHPVPHRREPRQRHAAAPRRASQHRRREGLLRRPEPVLRSGARDSLPASP